MVKILKNTAKQISKDDISYVEEILIDGISENLEVEGKILKNFSFTDNK